MRTEREDLYSDVLVRMRDKVEWPHLDFMCHLVDTADEACGLYIAEILSKHAERTTMGHQL
jgi:hypothetical protein